MGGMVSSGWDVNGSSGSLPSFHPADGDGVGKVSLVCPAPLGLDSAALCEQGPHLGSSLGNRPY